MKEIDLKPIVAIEAVDRRQIDKKRRDMGSIVMENGIKL